jgi:hypothetical protein
MADRIDAKLQAELKQALKPIVEKYGNAMKGIAAVVVWREEMSESLSRGTLIMPEKQPHDISTYVSVQGALNSFQTNYTKGLLESLSQKAKGEAEDDGSD